MKAMSTFSLLEKQLDRATFNNFVLSRKSDKHCKGFDSYKHLIAMVYAQLTGAASLRDLAFCFNGHYEELNRYGFDTISKSALSYANQHRGVEVFIDQLQLMIHRASRKQKRELKDMILLLDSTPISLKGHGYDWTKDTKTRHTQGLKVHIEYAPNEGLITYAKITHPTVNDLCIGKELDIQKGATYVFDKGYCDYDWWFKIDQENAYFVTRLKKTLLLESLRKTL